MKDVFCKIIDGKIPSKTIYEDDLVMTIMDVSPRSDGHLLIIPKKHYQDLYDIEEDIINHIMKIAREMCVLVTEKLHCDGITLEQNNGISQEELAKIIATYSEGLTASCLPPIPKYFELSFSQIPMIARIGENEVGFNIFMIKLVPSTSTKESNHEVIVVPTLAPMIMPTA